MESRLTCGKSLLILHGVILQPALQGLPLSINLYYSAPDWWNLSGPAIQGKCMYLWYAFLFSDSYDVSKASSRVSGSG